MSLNKDVELHIRQNFSWAKLPASVKQLLGNSLKSWEKAVSEYSVRNQLRWRGNIVRHVIRDERKYYEDLLQYSRDHLMVNKLINSKWETLMPSLKVLTLTLVIPISFV
jgi:hypothetical protein